MVGKRRIESIIVGVVSLVVLGIAPAALKAASVNDLTDAVSREYSAGGISDREAKDTLLLVLKDAASAPTPEDRSAILESFGILVVSLTGEKITSQAANTLMGILAAP